MKGRTHLRAARREERQGESGQAMVEFGLILFPLLVIVGGIIWFGIGLNYWLDMQRTANQGARWAVVNSWPTCPRTSANTLAPHPADGCTTTLQRYIACQQVPSALKPTVTVSFPTTGVSSTRIGAPVQVQISTPFKLTPILGIGTINLRARATMRLEQDAVRYAAGSFTATTCP